MHGRPRIRNTAGIRRFSRGSGRTPHPPPTLANGRLVNGQSDHSSRIWPAPTDSTPRRSAPRTPMKQIAEPALEVFPERGRSGQFDTASAGWNLDARRLSYREQGRTRRQLRHRHLADARGRLPGQPGPALLPEAATILRLGQLTTAGRGRDHTHDGIRDRGSLHRYCFGHSGTSAPRQRPPAGFRCASAVVPLEERHGVVTSPPPTVSWMGGGDPPHRGTENRMGKRGVLVWENVNAPFFGSVNIMAASSSAGLGTAVGEPSGPSAASADGSSGSSSPRARTFNNHETAGLSSGQDLALRSEHRGVGRRDDAVAATGPPPHHRARFVDAAALWVRGCRCLRQHAAKRPW